MNGNGITINSLVIKHEDLSYNLPNFNSIPPNANSILSAFLIEEKQSSSVQKKYIQYAGLTIQNKNLTKPLDELDKARLKLENIVLISKGATKFMKLTNDEKEIINSYPKLVNKYLSSQARLLNSIANSYNDIFTFDSNPNNTLMHYENRDRIYTTIFSKEDFQNFFSYEIDIKQSIAEMGFTMEKTILDKLKKARFVPGAKALAEKWENGSISTREIPSPEIVNQYIIDSKNELEQRIIRIYI